MFSYGDEMNNFSQRQKMRTWHITVTELNSIKAYATAKANSCDEDSTRITVLGKSTVIR